MPLYYGADSPADAFVADGSDLQVFIWSDSVTEAATATDVVSAGKATSASIAEAASAADSLTGFDVDVGIISEVATATDLVSATRITFASIVEIGGVDISSNRRVWYKFDQLTLATTPDSSGNNNTGTLVHI